MCYSFIIQQKQSQISDIHYCVMQSSMEERGITEEEAEFRTQSANSCRCRSII